MAQRVKTPGMMHLNNNLLCAIDTETTGDIPGYHDMIQVAFIPLGADLNPYKEISPFYMDLQPKWPENASPEAMRRNRMKLIEAQINGMEPYRAADLFDEWFKKLGLGYEKRIIPLAHNWPFDRGFIIDWLGKETVNQYIDVRYRDTMVMASFCNDLADHRSETYPYAKVDLTYLCGTMKIERERAHDALQDALATAKVYKQLLKRFI